MDKYLMSLKEKFDKIFKPQNLGINTISTKRETTILILTFILIALTFVNYRLVFLDVMAILLYYFMPKYGYDDYGMWRIIGKKKSLYFSWREVKEIDLNGNDLYFLLRNDKIIKLPGVRDAYKLFIVFKNKI